MYLFVDNKNMIKKKKNIFDDAWSLCEMKK